VQWVNYGYNTPSQRVATIRSSFGEPSLCWIDSAKLRNSFAAAKAAGKSTTILLG
jgi:hypothetical protein